MRTALAGLLAVALVFPLARYARAGEVEALLSKLEDKGILTAAEVLEIQKESVPSLVNAALNAPESGDKVAESAAIHVGQGTLKLDGLFQGWAVYDADANDKFRIRRTEIKLSGDILGDERFKYTLMLDPAQVQEDNGRRSVLQDAYFTLDRLLLLSNHTITLGQFKAPRTEEGTRSSSKLDFAERSIITRTFGDQRDIGVMLTGKWPIATYQLGVFNGGQNQAPGQDQKSLIGRLVVRPFRMAQGFMDLPDIGRLELGISGEHRPHSGDVLPKKRLGYEARYTYNSLSLNAEYTSGQGTASASSTSENTSNGKGWYTQAGYMLKPWFPKAQILARVEGWDPSNNASLDSERDLSLGVNYFLEGNRVKWQLNWVHKERQNNKIDNQVISALQYAF